LKLDGIVVSEGGWGTVRVGFSGRREEVGDTALSGSAVVLVACSSLLAHFRDGRGFGRAESGVQEMSKTTCHGGIVSTYFGCRIPYSMLAGKLVSLLSVAMVGLIWSDPCIIAVGPYKIDNAI
jgi:hypothetical protein